LVLPSLAEQRPEIWDVSERTLAHIPNFGIFPL
jgi:hypothetical protein